jgi:membrane protein required for colicin V production
MLIDAVYVILVAIACYKGLRKGFIIAVFSVAGFIIGIAAALKLSTVVAFKLVEHTGAGKWLPALSFLLVFVVTAFAVNLVGKLVQKTFETVMLGWVNRLVGVALYILLYSIIYSVFLFYALQLHFVKTETTLASIVYPYLQPLAPKIINSIGVVVPLFKDMFAQLERFFAGISQKI